MGKESGLSYLSLLSVFCTAIILIIDVSDARLVWARQVRSTNDEAADNFNNIHSEISAMVMYFICSLYMDEPIRYIIIKS